MMPLERSRFALTIGLGCAAAYAAATILLPPPPADWRDLAPTLLLFSAAAAAGLSCARAARVSREGERAFWTLLAAACAAGAASQALLAVHGWGGAPGLRIASQAGYHAGIALVVVALLVRPQRPRTLQQARRAALDWLAAAVLGCFLVLYFAVPLGAAQGPWSAVLLAERFLPAALAVALAARTGADPFRVVYQLMGAGLAAGAVGSVYPEWLSSRGEYQSYSAWEALWAMPFVALAAASRLAPAAGWRRARWVPVRSAPRALIALAAAVPPLVDLIARELVRLPARQAAQRTELALAAGAAIALLAAARLRGETPARAQPPADADEARRALGEPNPYVQFTSGVAHELNNPLTAVSGWAELALHAGGEAEPLRGVLAAARAAAEIVQQLQRATHEAGRDT